MVTQQTWDRTRTGQRSPTVSLSISLLFPLFIPPDRLFPTLVPTGSNVGQWTVQDPVLMAAQTQLVPQIKTKQTNKKPPRRENRSVVAAKGWNGKRG